MKILLMNEKWGLSGGQEEYILRVGNGLISRGHSVLLIHGHTEGEFPKTQFENRLIPDLEISAVLKEATKFSPQVINLQNVFDPSLVSELNQNYPTTRFVHDHSTYCPGNSKYFFNSQKVCPIATSPFCLINAYKEKCMTRRPKFALKKIFERQKWLKALKKLPLILCNSSYVRENLLKNGLHDSQVLVNHLFPGHNFLGRDDVSIGLYPKGSNPQGKRPRILFVGRLFKEKGVDLLIKACALIKEGSQLLIVGEGWESRALTELARQLGISNKVEFLGFKTGNDLSDLYHNCDIFVMPSVWPEPFGMVGLEANASCLPVVAFKVGGVLDWLVDGENGLIPSEIGVEALSQTLVRLLKDENLRKGLGDKGRVKVQKEFSLERHLTVLEEVYSKIAR